MDKISKRKRLYLWWVNHQLTSFYGTILFICVIANLIADYYDIEIITTISFAVVFVLTVIYLIHYNQHNLYKYLHNNKNVSHLPEKQIRRLNKVFMSIFLVAASVVMFLVSRLPYKTILSALWSWIKAGLRFLFSLIQSEPEDAPEQIVEELPTQDNSMFEGLFQQETKERNPFWDYVVQVFAIAVIALLLCYIIYSIYKKIVTREKHGAYEEREFISPFAKKEKLAKASAYKERSLITDLSYNGRIRKLYRKTVMSKLPSKHAPLAPLTPAEIEQHAGLGNEEAEKLLHDFYEKARYSDTGCSKKDYETLRKK